MSLAWSRHAGAERIQLSYRPDPRLRWHARIDDPAGLRTAIAGCRTPWGALLGVWKTDRQHRAEAAR